MRYVLDTDVIVAAMRSPLGASAALLLAALDQHFALFGIEVLLPRDALRRLF